MGVRDQRRITARQLKLAKKPVKGPHILWREEHVGGRETRGHHAPFWLPHHDGQQLVIVGGVCDTGPCLEGLSEDALDLSNVWKARMAIFNQHPLSQVRPDPVDITAFCYALFHVFPFDQRGPSFAGRAEMLTLAIEIQVELANILALLSRNRKMTGVEEAGFDGRRQLA